MMPMVFRWLVITMALANFPAHHLWKSTTLRWRLLRLENLDNEIKQARDDDGSFTILEKQAIIFKRICFELLFFGKRNGPKTYELQWGRTSSTFYLQLLDFVVNEG